MYIGTFASSPEELRDEFICEIGRGNDHIKTPQLNLTDAFTPRFESKLIFSGGVLILVQFKLDPLSELQRQIFSIGLENYGEKTHEVVPHTELKAGHPYHEIGRHSILLAAGAPQPESILAYGVAYAQDLAASTIDYSDLPVDSVQHQSEPVAIIEPPHESVTWTDTRSLISV